MVAHELLVSLLATYSASEYLYGSRRRARCAALVTLAANALALLPSPVLHFHHKLPVVGASFLAALYCDTVIHRRQLSRGAFLTALLHAFVELLPLFPLLSLMLAFVFLEVGEFMEHLLGMSDARISHWFNQPIYFGVLYGPFAYLYVRVKALARGGTPLPMSV
jgi:hypothetical protein